MSPRRVTPNEIDIRNRWSEWLGALVGDGRAVTVKALDERITPNGRGSWKIYGWLEKEHTVSPESAFRVGEELRDLGVAWSCAPLALHGAGYIPDAVLACGLAASRIGEPNAAQILVLAKEANATHTIPLSRAAEAFVRRGCFDTYTESQVKARAQCAELLANYGQRFSHIYNAWSKCRREEGAPPGVPTVFHIARTLMQAPLPLAEREVFSAWLFSRTLGIPMSPEALAREILKAVGGGNT